MSRRRRRRPCPHRHPRGRAGRPRRGPGRRGRGLPRPRGRADPDERAAGHRDAQLLQARDLRAGEAKFDEVVGRPGEYDRSLAYSHAALRDQFERQDIRGLELDLFPDPAGGLYTQPFLRTLLGLGPLADPAWARPGIKVFHVADLDYATTCVAFVTCLQQVKSWSDDHPRHVPLLILLELKSSEPRIVEAGGVAAPPWEAGALDGLDAEIRSVFGEDDLITPDDVRRPA
jgi:hypothetical protein